MTKTELEIHNGFVKSLKANIDELLELRGEVVEAIKKSQGINEAYNLQKRFDQISRCIQFNQSCLEVLYSENTVVLTLVKNG